MFPGVSKSARSSLASFWRENPRGTTHPTRLTYRISVDCPSLSLSLFFSWWSHRYFSPEKLSNIRICEYLTRDWAIKGRELSIELLIFCIFSFGVVFSFRRNRWLMIVEERWCMRDELVLEIVGFIQRESLSKFYNLSSKSVWKGSS